MNISIFLRSPRRWRFAGAEDGSRNSQIVLNALCERVRATEHASRDPPLRVFEPRHGLAEIVERGAVVREKRLRVSRPHFERDYINISEDALRHGYLSAHQRLGFFEAL